jgi:BlaI family penicillinase repressor
MKPISKISEAEWEVMKILWKKSPLSSQEVANELSQKTTWHPKTVKTLINRLLKKKVLGFKKEGRSYFFYPLLAESQCVLAESQSFLDRVFGGALQPMVAHLVKEQKLSDKDIKELQEILKGKVK